MAKASGPRKRRKFTPEFKAEAVRLCRVGDRSIGQVATDLGLTDSGLREWVRRADVDAGGPTGCADDRRAGGASGASETGQATRDGARDTKKPSRASPDLLGEKLMPRYKKGRPEGASVCFLEARPR